MTHSDEFKKVEKYLNSQSALSEREDVLSRKALPTKFVTISREAGAGGETLGQYFSDYMNSKVEASDCPWTVFDKNLVQHALEEHGLSAKMASFIPEKHISEIKDSIEEIAGLHPPAFRLLKDISETMLKLARLGSCVLVGRGANIVTSSIEGGIHIRLHGSKKRRIERIASRHNMNESEAKSYLEEEDKNRSDYLKEHFNKNIDDTRIYTMSFNTDVISNEDIAQIIRATIS